MRPAPSDADQIYYAALRQYELGRTESEVSDFIFSRFGHVRPEIRIPALVEAVRARAVGVEATASVGVSLAEAAARTGVPLGEEIEVQYLIEWTGAGPVDPDTGVAGSEWRTVRVWMPRDTTPGEERDFLRNILSTPTSPPGGDSSLEYDVTVTGVR